MIRGAEGEAVIMTDAEGGGVDINILQRKSAVETPCSLSGEVMSSRERI